MKSPLLALLILPIILTEIRANFSDNSASEDYRISSATLRLRNRLFGKRKHRTICSVDNDDNNANKLRETVRNTDFVFTGTVVGVAPKSVRSSRRIRLRKRKKKVEPDQSNNIQPVEGTTEPPPKPQTFIVEVKRVIKTDTHEPLTSNVHVTVRVPSEYVSGVQLTSDPLLNTNCVEFHPVLKMQQTSILLAQRMNDSHTLQLTSYPIAMTLRHLERVDSAVKGNLGISSITVGVVNHDMDTSQYDYDGYRYHSNEYINRHVPYSGGFYPPNYQEDYSFQRNHRFYASVPRSTERRLLRGDQGTYGGTSVSPPPMLEGENQRARLRPTLQPSFDGDDGGFQKKNQQSAPAHQQALNTKPLANNVVVDGNGVSSVVRNPPVFAEPDTCCCLTGLCSPSGSSPTPGEEGGLCRPSVLLLLLVLLIIVFICVSAILLYLNYSTFKPRPQIVEEPCETVHCTFGSNCVIESDGRTHCKCPTSCSSTYNPVCGTDGTTYNNECYLRRNSCINQISLRIRHEGECERVDPCKGKVCPFGARCVASPDGETSECRCPEACPILGDHIGSRPVCGSDGLDYRDTCELRRAACMSSTEITVKYQGKCDPCAKVECSEPEICQLDSDRQPECKCGETCSLEFTPVCGSDGKTYSNDCSLRQEACRTRKPLKIIYRGKCSSGVNPCSSVRCTLGEECVINKYGIARCECPSSCEPVVRPVCGKDLKTYDNECELRRSSCLTRTDIQINYTGACGGQGPCSTHTCTHGANCVERSGNPSCECPTCPSEFAPVCGSDGISYGNECKLRLEACQHRRDISVLYQGLCNGCEEKRCEYYSVCESDGSSEAKCVCPESCEGASGSSVCGTDGQTYSSECELRIHSCRIQTLISVAYKASCDACAGVTCNHGARCEAGLCVCPTNCSTSEPSELVCASNMITYGNECEMMKASCSQPEHLPPLTIIFFGDCREKFSVPFTTLIPPFRTNLVEGPQTNGTNDVRDKLREREREVCRDIHCDFDASCELGPDGNPRCSCKFDCHNAVSNAKHFCASDLRLYPSICAMKMEGCQRQEELRLRPLELCEGMEVKPCNGEAPLVNPVTKMEFDCGATSSRQDCPAGSYCHHTRHFAKCCRKDLNTLFDNCLESWYGCCPDGKTIAQGPDDSGCPSLCGCNKLGSFGDTCEPETGQCNCKPGVGGVKCDRCMPGYWGLPKISEGHNGCLPCECSALGSVRDDCEQMTGRCVCKPGVQGQKCTVCQGFGKVLALNGCVTEDEAQATELPLKRSTGVHFTEPEAISSPLYKSTRHLLVPDPRVIYKEDSSPLTSATFYQLADTSRNLYNTAYHTGYKPTPATIHITALLGDLCEISADCGVPHSVCTHGSCTCPEDYLETPDRQQCVAHNLLPTPFNRAYAIPSFDGKAYIQLKRLKAYNKLTIEIEFKTYAYDGILMYSQQKADGTGDFVSLAIVNGYLEFRYNLGNGAVVITAPEKIQLKRFHRVVAKRYHRDGILKLDDFEDVAGQSLGTLKSLDLEEDAFLGSVPTEIPKVFENIGTNKGLMGCIRHLKLGRHLSELHVGRDPLIQKVEGVTECGENPCSNLPCQNSGTCFAVDSERYRCTCAKEFTGEHCETWLNPCLSNPCGFASTCEPSPGGGYNCHCTAGRTGDHCHLYDLDRIESHPCQFGGSSYVELPRLENVGRAFTLEMWFLSDGLDGLLLYNGQLGGGKGDFIALSIKQSKVVFQFDLGSGPANITSVESITPGHWHALKISRLDREGTVQLDSGLVSMGTSGPPLNELNLELPLYIGGVPPGVETNKEVKIPVGFAGSIQRLVVNGLAWGDLCNTGTGKNVAPYMGPPCNSACLNGGVCLPLLNDFSCICPTGYSGHTCHQQITDNGVTTAVRFSREFFMEFPNKVSKSTNSTNTTNTGYEYAEEEYDEIELDEDYDEDMYDSEDTSEFFQNRKKSEQVNNKVEIVFRTALSDGLLLWLGKSKSTRADYFSVTLVRGFPTLSFSLGRHKSVLTLTSKVWVSDNKWHSVIANRRKRRGFIQVDDEQPIKGVAAGNASVLSTSGKLYLGGAPLLPAGLPEEYYVGFAGCIESAKIDKTPLALTTGRSDIQFCVENDV